MPLIKVRDVTLYYEIHGVGETLLFIHGLGLSTRDWEKQADFFSRKYRVVTFDLRGHGRSAKPPGPYSIAQFTDDTVALIHALDIAPVHLAGISMGGMIAFEMAVKTPELLKTLIIVNSGPEFIIRRVRERIEMVKRHVLLRMFSMRATTEYLTKRLFPKPEQEELYREVVERWSQNDKKSYLASFNALEGWTVKKELGRIKIPTLVVAADQDYTSVSYKKRWMARIPDAQMVVIPDSRHATPLDQPDIFNRVVDEFLSRHE